MVDELEGGNPLLTAAEVAALLQVPKSWVYEHSRPSSHPRIPCVKLGKYLRFRRSDIEAFAGQMSGNHVAPRTRRE